MTRQKPDDVLKEVNKQEDDNYGDESISGSNPVTGEGQDVDDMMKDVVGDDFDEDKPLDIADEVNDDEEAIREDEIDDYKEEPEIVNPVPEDELEKVERKEGLATEDPMDKVSDEDFTSEDEEEDSKE